MNPREVATRRHYWHMAFCKDRELFSNKYNYLRNKKYLLSLGKEIGIEKELRMVLRLKNCKTRQRVLDNGSDLLRCRLKKYSIIRAKNQSYRKKKLLLNEFLSRYS
jgi:hypothetical protein